MTSPHTDTDRYPIYEIGGVVYYRASAIGGCINELVMMRRGELGEDRSQYIQDVLDTGKDTEAAVKAAVATQVDMTLAADHEAVALEIDPGHVIVGNTDGRLAGPFTNLSYTGTEAGVEIKTLGEDSMRNFIRSGLERFPEYQWQLSVYMHATGLPFIYAAAPRMREKADGGTWRFWVEPEKVHILGVITEPPIPLVKIRRKIRRINALAELGMDQLPMCEKAKFCSMARFHDLIGGNVEAEMAEVVESDDDLYGLVVRRRELKMEEDRIAAERKDVDEQLKALMEGPVAIRGLGRLVPVLMPGRTTYDTQQMVMELGAEAMEKYEKQGSPYAQLRWYEEKK